MDRKLRTRQSRASETSFLTHDGLIRYVKLVEQVVNDGQEKKNSCFEEKNPKKTSEKNKDDTKTGKTRDGIEMS